MKGFEFEVEKVGEKRYKMLAKHLDGSDSREVEFIETTLEEIELAKKSGTDQEIFQMKFNPKFIATAEDYFTLYHRKERIIKANLFN